MLNSLRNSVRGRLACLILAITLPAVLLVLLLVLQAYRNERESVGQHLLSTARAIAAVVDREIGESELLLKGLAAAYALQREELARFEERLRSVPLGKDRWLVLLDRDGRQLINTRAPVGAPLPRQDFSGDFRAAIERGETFVSNLVASPLAKDPVAFVAVPVLEDGKLRYALCYLAAPSALASSIQLGHFSLGMIVAIVDRTGRIAGRGFSGDQIGELAVPEIVTAVTGGAEGLLNSVTIAGVDVLAAHSRGARAGWSVVMGAPYAQLYRSAQGMLLTGLVASSVMMALAIFVATWIAREVVRSVDQLVRDTDAMGRGEIPPARESALEETGFVAEAMRKTARTLAEREHENARLTLALQAELEHEKRAEEANRRLASMVQSSDDAIIGIDDRAVITSWNPGAERTFRYTPEEIVGQPATVLIPEERQGEELSIMARIRRGERVEPFETVRRRKDGSFVPVSLSVSPIRDHAGRITGASKISRDISQRKRAEEQHAALFDLVATVNRADELPQIFDAAMTAMTRSQHPDRVAILLTDPAGVMRFRASRGLSAEYCRAVEGHSPWAPTDVHPKPIWVSDVARATLAVELRLALSAEGIRALVFVPLVVQRRLIGKFMLYYNAPREFSAEELRPVQTIASQVAFALERQRNADALEALVDARTASLREAVAQMEEFSYSVSHDLRAPARAMFGYADAILQDHAAGLDPVGLELLGRIKRNSLRMDRLIQDLLSYTRVSRREVRLEPVALEKLIREIVLQYPDLRPERADIEICGVLPEVVAHEPSLTQVVSNLLNNGVKFIPAGTRPRVQVGCNVAGGRVRVWFHDNGIGIKPEAQKRLFQMFERLHPEKHYEGTGIGLAIVRRALERMNGSAGVESDGVPGRGSRFWFELPLAGEEERAARGETAEPNRAAQATLPVTGGA